MTMRRLFLAAGLTIWVLPTAQADECMDKAIAQADMNVCAQQAYKAADVELNKLYREIEQRLGDAATSRKQLVAAQRAWVAFRDAECAFVSSAVDGGSAHPMVADLCLAAVTQKRIEDLKQYLNCEEGDLSCPVPPAN